MWKRQSEVENTADILSIIMTLSLTFLYCCLIQHGIPPSLPQYLEVGIT